MNPALLHRLSRSLVAAFILAGLVALLPGMYKIQVAEAVGEPVRLSRFTEAAARATQSQSNCGSQTRIVEECSLAALPGIQALEQQVIADLLAIHQLPVGGGTTVTDPFLAPQDNASRLLSSERDSLRALLFGKIGVIIAKAPAARTAQEQAIVDALATLVKQTRVKAATEARRYYDLWLGGPCTFTPPAGFSYSPPTHCFIPNSTGSIFQFPPSLEQFQAYGAAVANQRFSTDADLQAAAANTAKAFGLLAGITAAGIAGFIASSFVGFGSSGVVLVLLWATAATAGYGSVSAAYSALIAAIGAVGVAAAVLIAQLSVAIGVIAGITIFTAAEIPAKLDAAIAAAQATPDLKALLDTDAGKNEIFAAYIATTVPTAGLVGPLNGWSPVSAAQSGDQKFIIDPGPLQQVSAELAFKSWDGTGQARLSQGWFVDQTVATAPALTLELDYINHADEQWTASRVGDHFLHTTFGNVKPAFESDVIQYKDAAGVNHTAKINPLDRTAPTANPSYSPPPNAAGWNNSDVTVTWNWSDNPGGDGLNAATCPATSTIGPGQIVSVTCTDLAGNQRSTATTNVKVDTKAPVFTGPATLSPQPNAVGWNNSDVIVTFACSDGETGGISAGGISGIASCGPTHTLTSEGRNQSVTGTATDVAGNSATQTKDGINLDKTVPVVTRNQAADSCATPGTNGWCRGVQTAGFQASDALSGLTTPAQASFTRTSTSEGAAVMIESGAVSDVAGSTNPGVSAGPFKIDSKAPTFSTPPANQTVNATGPSGAAVSYTATATDAVDTAPVVTCSKKSGETFPIGATTVSRTATDQAGNSTPVSFTVTVKSAATQLTELKTAVTGVGPGTSLADKLQMALTAVQAGNTTTACSVLQDFLNQARAQDGKSLTAAQAQQFTADATRIRAVLGCR